jgi:hypothetical protein
VLALIEAALRDGRPLNEDDIRATTAGGRLTIAIERHRKAFGTRPALWGLAGIAPDDELARLIQAAVDAGRPFDPKAAGRVLGIDVGVPPEA